MRNIRIEASACLWWAALLLILPLRWLIAAVIAAVFHEFCHYLAIRAVCGDVKGMVIRHTGASMDTTPLESWQELICALAGPVGSLILILFARLIPITALCALVQSAFNLLPIFPLDGGRVLQCTVRILWPHKNADKLIRWISSLCTTMLSIFVLLMMWRFSFGFGILLPLMFLILRSFSGKRPCKTARLALQ